MSRGNSQCIEGMVAKLHRCLLCGCTHFRLTEIVSRKGGPWGVAGLLGSPSQEIPLVHACPANKNPQRGGCHTSCDLVCRLILPGVRTGQEQIVHPLHRTPLYRTPSTAGIKMSVGPESTTRHDHSTTGLRYLHGCGHIVLRTADGALTPAQREEED